MMQFGILATIRPSGASALPSAALLAVLLASTACHREGPAQVQDLTIGTDLEGKLGLGSQQVVHTVHIAEAGLYQFDMHSTAVDPHLQLTGNRIERSNHDGGEGMDARIIVYLPPGEYALQASNSADWRWGEYRISSSKRDMPGDTTLDSGHTLVPGMPTHGLLQEKPLTYHLVVPDRSQAIVKMRSDDFHGKLDLEEPKTRAFAQEDERGYSARLALPPSAGTYSVTVSGLDEDSSGLFAIELCLTQDSLGQAESPSSVATSPQTQTDDTDDGQLADGCSEASSG